MSLAASWNRSTAQTTSPAIPAENLEFFENRVRPVLVEHCYECHSASTTVLKGGLRLDTAAGTRGGGASGPLFRTDQPQSSRILLAVKGTDPEIKSMPPKGPRLTATAIADLEEWVRRGAPDPRIDTSGSPAPDPRKHWAFQIPVRTTLPRREFESFPVRNPVDLFIQSQLAKKGLEPSTEADRRTLLRRASVRVTGLLPTPDEMDAFLTDGSPDAYERAVDRLLASPRYGERWGRHWLDVARYADSKGYVFEEARRYPYSFTYRDWVVGAINRDLPYNEFLIQQIAGDRIATTENPSPLAALGFLTLGRRFLNNAPDIIDDRIDVVCRGTMALTVQCARCHDHKFDPIPTADYYSLYGIFQSSHEPAAKPLLAQNPNHVKRTEFEKEHAKRLAELEQYRAARTADVLKKLRNQVAEYLRTAHEGMGPASTNLEAVARSRKLDPGLVNAWKAQLETWRARPDPVFVPWFAFARIPAEGFGAASAQVAAKLLAPDTDAPPANPWVARTFAETVPASFDEVISQYGKLFSTVDDLWQRELSLAQTNRTDPPLTLANRDQEAVRELLYSPKSPIVAATGDINRFFDTPTAQKQRELRRKVDEFEATHPGAPLRAMALIDNEKGADSPVFKRGNPGSHGPVVPRRFLELLSPTNRAAFKNGSGRLELAQAIASRSNPLTARVWVNRTWNWHFGSPLVATPSDFGVRSDPPSHPELLDWLAVWFMDEGWSMKKLHALLLTSHAFRQVSASDSPVAARAESIDPMNSSYWRMNRNRADLEALRDNLLAAAGNLDLSMGGQAVEVFSDKSQPRRTLYGYIDRQNLPGMLRSFDFANPDSTAPMRFQTTVPQQALFFMNSPFVREQARFLAARAARIAGNDDTRRIRELFRTSFQRAPTADESKASLEFIAQQNSTPPMPPPATAAWSYGWGSLDESSGRLDSFKAFAHFQTASNPKEGMWRIESKFPLDDERAYLNLGSSGGHPGRTLKQAAVRRWTSPSKGILKIKGRLHHPGEVGDGVRARVVQKNNGTAHVWTARASKTKTTVEALDVDKGDTVDFVVDCITSDNTDSFQWTLELSLHSGSGEVQTWNSATDFSGPTKAPEPLTSWEKLAQALLAANEFVFTD